MGLLRALAGLPLAPLKGLIALAEHVQKQSDQEEAQELADLQAELLELQFIEDQRGLEEEFAEKEAHLLEKIGALAGAEKAGGQG